MEGQQSWRPRLSFRSATIMMCLLNVITALLLLQCFLSSASSRSKLSTSQLNSAKLRYVRESEEIRLAMRPLELIKRVKEIQQEAYAKPETVQEKDTKQTVAAVFPVWGHIMTLPAGSCILVLAFRAFVFPAHALNWISLEEWRKRKMERARLRELEKNGTLASQA